MERAVENEVDELERLRRHLRALSAVNRQLHAQLESGGHRSSGGGDLLATEAPASNALLRLHRAGSGSAWLEQLELQASGAPPRLVRGPDGSRFLVDGALRRRVSSGLLYAALHRRLGPPGHATSEEVDAWSEGPPVAVLEGGTGPPFVVVGGRRLALRGLPLPYPVTTDEMMRFPAGDELDVAAAAKAAVRPGTLERGRGLVAREGPVAAVRQAFRKAQRRLR